MVSYVRTRAENLPAVANFANQCLKTSDTLSNAPARIVLLKTMALRYTTTPWQLRFELYSTAQVSLPNFGLPLFYTPSTSIIALCTRLPTKLLLKVGTDESLTSLILKRLVLVCVSNTRAHGTTNLTFPTSQVSSLATQQRTRTSSTSTCPPVLSNLATTPCLTRHGTSNLPDLLWPNCYTT